MFNILNQQASPYHASVNWNFRDDSEDDKALIYAKIDQSVSIDVRLALASSKATNLVLAMTKKFDIHDPERVGEVARIVREIFVDKITGQEIVDRAMKKLKLLPAKKEQFLGEVKNVVLQIKAIAKEEKAIVFDEMPIIPAIRKYQDKLSSQEISFERLSIPELDRKRQFSPTVKSWIDDYIEKKGAKAHPILVRNDYLFNSPNAKMLNDEERERVAETLESYDEDKPLLIYKLEGDPQVYFQPKQKPSRENSFESESEKSEASSPERIWQETVVAGPAPVQSVGQQGKTSPQTHAPSQAPIAEDLVIESSQLADHEKRETAPVNQKPLSQEPFNQKPLSQKSLNQKPLNQKPQAIKSKAALSTFGKDDLLVPKKEAARRAKLDVVDLKKPS